MSDIRWAGEGRLGLYEDVKAMQRHERYTAHASRGFPLGQDLSVSPNLDPVRVAMLKFLGLMTSSPHLPVNLFNRRRFFSIDAFCYLLLRDADARRLQSIPLAILVSLALPGLAETR